MNEAKLLACPFCGKEAEIERPGTARASMIIACTNCGGRMESGDVVGLTSPEQYAWNVRAGGRQPEPSKTGETKHVCISDLLAAVKSWRTAEVHHAAITLELRGGDELMAKSKLEDATRELRIAADAYVKAANTEAERPAVSRARPAKESNE